MLLLVFCLFIWTLVLYMKSISLHYNTLFNYDATFANSSNTVVQQFVTLSMLKETLQHTTSKDTAQQLGTFNKTKNCKYLS